MKDGAISINPTLLNPNEFLRHDAQFDCLNVNGEACSYRVEASQLAFTYCQVPFIYEKGDTASIMCQLSDASIQTFNTLALTKTLSQSIFVRDNVVEKVKVIVPDTILRQS